MCLGEESEACAPATATTPPPGSPCFSRMSGCSAWFKFLGRGTLPPPQCLYPIPPGQPMPSRTSRNIADHSETSPIVPTSK